MQPAAVDVQVFALWQEALGHWRNRTQLLFVGHVTSHLHDVEQSMLPVHAPEPHVTEQEPGPQFTPAPQELGPQLAEQLDEVVQLMPPLHALSRQVTEQLPGPHVMALGQAELPHSTVQFDDAEQSIAPRHEVSLHRMVHGPAPQWMAVGHAVVPVHAMSQLEARVQSIPALQAVDPHSTRQGTPAGQVTWLVQLLVTVQSTTHVAPEHVPMVQAARQAATAAASGASAVAESRTVAPPEPVSGHRRVKSRRSRR